MHAFPPNKGDDELPCVYMNPEEARILSESLAAVLADLTLPRRHRATHIAALQAFKRAHDAAHGLRG